jgi:hypothetical protein
MAGTAAISILHHVLHSLRQQASSVQIVPNYQLHMLQYFILRKQASSVQIDEGEYHGCMSRNSCEQSLCK